MNEARTMRDEVIAGLTATPKTLPPKFFYDALGSKLFEAITMTPEYYPTGCELEVLAERGGEIAAEIGPRPILVELGSGVSAKVPLLLDAMPDISAYVPVDIDAATLEVAARRMVKLYPGLHVVPVAADFTHPWDLPELPEDGHTVFWYPGSTIGNLEPEEAERFLGGLVSRLDPGEDVLMGFDLAKEAEIVELAYDDPAGVTAAFNRNMLGHLNRAVGTDFDVAAFEHVAEWNPIASRVEIFLRATREATVSLGEHRFEFAKGELLHTEHSYKYTRERFREMAERVGLREHRFWTDAKGWFAVGLYRWDG